MIILIPLAAGLGLDIDSGDGKVLMYSLDVLCEHSGFSSYAFIESPAKMLSKAH